MVEDNHVVETVDHESHPSVYPESDKPIFNHSYNTVKSVVAHKYPHEEPNSDATLVERRMVMLATPDGPVFRVAHGSSNDSGHTAVRESDTYRVTITASPKRVIPGEGNFSPGEPIACYLENKNVESSRYRGFPLALEKVEDGTDSNFCSAN